MAFRVILALILVVGLMLLASWLGKASPAQRSAALKNILIYGVAGVLILLVLTGRIPWLFAILGAALPWLQRGMMAMRAWNTLKAFRGPSQNQQSRVNTPWLAMSLDHETGDIDGEVLQGGFTGARLSQLSLEQLQQLLTELSQRDAQSVALVEAYLDRYHSDWRPEGYDEQQKASPPGGSAPMTRDEALAILGLEEGASHDDIIDAHRRLMLKMHPDRGGPVYLATRINQARDLLTG